MKHHSHETKVLAIFKNSELAQKGLQALEALHFNPHDIQYINNWDEYEKEEMAQFLNHQIHENSLHQGKVLGVAGALLGAATTMTGILTAGGSLIIAGPLAAITLGAGGVLGSIIGAGFTEEESKKIDNSLSAGEVMIVFHAETRQLAKLAKQELSSYGAQIYSHH